MTQKIIHHEDWQGVNLREFVAIHFRREGWGEPPPFDRVNNQVFAVINQGRWLVECPMLDGCAMSVSEIDPYFLCVTCGSPENNNNWYRVVFPANKRAIEALLLKRPAKNNFYATTRNWTPAQTASDLQQENDVRGVA